VRVLVASLLVACGSSSALALEKLTVERINSEPSLQGALPTDVAWTPDGRRLTWLRPPAKPGGSSDLWSLDPASGRSALLLEAGRVKVAGPDGAAALGSLRLQGYSWTPDGQGLLVPAQGDLFLVDARTGAARPLVKTSETEEFAELSPDGRRVAFVRNHDLYVVEVESGRETRLTRSGSDTVLNGRLDWVYEEELASRSGRAFEWSPDSRKIAYLQLDQARVPTFPLVDFLPVHNAVSPQRYPKAGDPNAIVRVGVVGLARDGAAGPERHLSFTPDDLYVVPDLAWAPDSDAVLFQQLNRDQNEIQLRALGVPSEPAADLAAPRTVLTERSDTWVNVLPAPVFLKDGRRFLWLSERSGYAHVYLCDLAGACRPVTQGPWIVDAQSTFASRGLPLQLDERTGFVYFMSTEKDARERHLYRARLDGTGRQRLTVDDGVHKAVLSPDARFFVDSFSSVEAAPRTEVVSVDGRRRIAVEANTAPPQVSFERGLLEWVEVKAADGTVLHGSLLKPADFDPSRRYPVVVTVYGGPGAQSVQNSWQHASPFKQVLASRGFLVFCLDNRGSTDRGRAFEAPLFRSLGKTELEDQLRGVDYLKSLPYVDPARLGIWGWSYGGYMTLFALANAPDVFRVGVAGAPVTDWKFYDSIYTERYMGKPAANAKGYEASSPLTKASGVKADLLILHGTADDNVHMANTVAFVDALVKAGRPYDLNVHPGQMHGYASRESRIARDRAVLRYLEERLKP